MNVHRMIEILFLPFHRWYQALQDTTCPKIGKVNPNLGPKWIPKISFSFLRNETSKEIWKWNGRVIEKFSRNIISKREPDDSFEMSTFYQGASAVVLAGNSCVLKNPTKIRQYFVIRIYLVIREVIEVLRRTVTSKRR